MFCASDDLVRRAEANLLEEVEAGAAVDGAELQADDGVVRVLRPPARRQLPKLAFLVVDGAARRPGQQRGVDVADTLAAAGRGNDDAMLGTVMAQVMCADACDRSSRRHTRRHAARPRPGRQQTASANIGFGLEPSRAMHAFVLFRRAAHRSRRRRGRHTGTRRTCRTVPHQTILNVAAHWSAHAACCHRSSPTAAYTWPNTGAPIAG